MIRRTNDTWDYQCAPLTAGCLNRSIKPVKMFQMNLLENF